MNIKKVNGVTWKLFKGTVSTWTVWSFVAPSELTGYNSDLKPFFSKLFSTASKTAHSDSLFLAYLINSQGLSSSKYLTGLQAGTEPFIGKWISSAKTRG